ncbi:MAG TPA: type II toxin-antitoxin system VapB family antitoxin [Propionibacteriaceae bacterium]|nr:type II toxin-antitoxin system VapB family antitoxin [Propionibacteriaceae bacterium]
MRTTVTIDDHLLAEAKARAARSHRTVGEVIDDALRLAFMRSTPDAKSARPFRLPSHGSGGLRPGVDLEDREALAEILGDNARLP